MQFILRAFVSLKSLSSRWKGQARTDLRDRLEKFIRRAAELYKGNPSELTKMPIPGPSYQDDSEELMD